jgi:hypothetical protein
VAGGGGCSMCRGLQVVAIRRERNILERRDSGGERDEFGFHPLELPAGGEDIAATRLAHEARHGSFDDLLKTGDSFGGGRAVGDTGAGIEGDEVDLAVEIRQELDDPAGVGIGIVDVFEEDVFEGEVLPRTQRVGAAGCEEIAQAILAGDGHQLAALFLGGCVERDGKFRADGFAAEFFDLGDDSGSGESEAAFAEADALGVGEEAGGFQDVGQIEQGLALAHQNDVEFVEIGEQAVARGDVQDLADDFAGGEIAFEAEQSGEAEPAIDGTTELRGDAEGVAPAFGICRPRVGGGSAVCRRRT